MAAEAFILYFESIPNDVFEIHVQDFLKNYFSALTPSNNKMMYGPNVNQARNCIIDNLYRNPFFIHKNHSHMRNSLEPIYLLLRETKNLANDCQMAQLTFLLHLSKANLDGKILETIFPKINTIRLTTNNFFFENDCTNFFNCLIENKLFKDIINNVVKLICGKETNFDYDSCRITYFNSYISGLNGFAGINQIYVSQSELDVLYILSTDYSTQERLIILKMYLTRLTVHELTHLVLRHTLNDFNLSSPKIYESNIGTNAASVSNGEPSYLIEAGLLAEKKLFTGKIDWKKSALNSNINVDYCKSFLDKLMTNQNEIDDFSIEASGVVLNNSPTIIMAVDYDFDSTPNFIFE